MPASRISVRNVSKSFSLHGRSLQVLSGIDLDIEEGSFLTIVGASGCGKSTLLKVIAGLLEADGRLEHDGHLVTGPSLDRGIVFQEPRLFPWLTVEQNVALGLENAALDRADKERLVREHLLLVGLSRFAKAYPGQLSGGMAQRAAIARGLVNRPSVLLMDEPFGALDALTRARLQDELQQIWIQERTTALFVTHDVDEAVLLGDRVVVMAPNPGRIARIFDVPLPRPRHRRSPDLISLRNDILDVLEATTDAAAPEYEAQPVAQPRTEALVLPA